MNYSKVLIIIFAAASLFTILNGMENKPAQESYDPNELVVLISKEGQELVVARKNAEKSHMMKNMLINKEKQNQKKKIILQEIDTQTLDVIKQLLEADSDEFKKVLMNIKENCADVKNKIAFHNAIHFLLLPPSYHISVNCPKGLKSRILTYLLALIPMKKRYFKESLWTVFEEGSAYFVLKGFDNNNTITLTKFPYSKRYYPYASIDPDLGETISFEGVHNKTSDSPFFSFEPVVMSLEKLYDFAEILENLPVFYESLVNKFEQAITNNLKVTLSDQEQELYLHFLETVKENCGETAEKLIKSSLRYLLQ